MTNIALIDPRFIDGEPWEVADQAGKQTIAALEIALEALDGFRWAAQGSWLSQEDYRTGRMPSHTEFDKNVLGVKLDESRMRLKHALKEMKTVVSAVAYDPRQV